MSESKFYELNAKLYGKESLELNEIAKQELFEGHFANAAAFSIEGTAKGILHAGNKALDVIGNAADRVRKGAVHPGPSLGAGLLGIPGMITGAKIQEAISGGHDVKEHGGPPVTPATPALRDKGKTGPK